MIPRKPLSPNNSVPTLGRQFVPLAARHTPAVKQYHDQSVVTYAQPGRQNSEGFGGGNRVRGARR